MILFENRIISDNITSVVCKDDEVQEWKATAVVWLVRCFGVCGLGLCCFGICGLA